jgi:hypothetical protein
MATLARWAFIFCWLGVLTLTLLYKHRKRIAYRVASLFDTVYSLFFIFLIIPVPCTASEYHVDRLYNSVPS